jgi:hypothetical protein
MFLSPRSRIVGDAHRADGRDAVMCLQVGAATSHGHTVTRRTKLHHSWLKIDGRDHAPESCEHGHDLAQHREPLTGRGDAAMATKKKGGSKRSAGKGSARRGGAKRGAKRSSAKKGGARKGAAKRGAAKKGAAARKGAAKKSSARGSTSRGAAKRGGAKRSGAKKSSAKRSSPRRKTSPLDRVKRVATGVVEQAQTAVSHGVDAVKELGENIVERVSG